MFTASAIFLVAYAIITTERVHKTIVALGGAVLVIAFNILSQEEAFKHVDFNVIFLLVGMMVMAAVLRKTGIFQWSAVHLAKIARGDPYALLILLSLLTAVLSAFLDNVTTVLLVGPITLYLATELELSPRPYLYSLIITSNIGGTATLIGDPPNILIGSASGLDFVSFASNLTPVVLVTLAAYLAGARLIFRRELEVHPGKMAALMELDADSMIRDPHLARLATALTGLTLVGFIFHGAMGYEPATVALAGAVALMLVAQEEPHDILREVEWPTIFFFIGLFIMVGALEKTGVISALAEAALALTKGDLFFTAMLILWMSGVASGIVDNVPYTATMIPLVQELGRNMDIGPLWWALALGACFGGNSTLVGAAANVVVAHMVEGSAFKISFRDYLKVAVVTTAGTLVLASVYLWMRYLR